MPSVHFLTQGVRIPTEWAAQALPSSRVLFAWLLPSFTMGGTALLLVMSSPTTIQGLARRLHIALANAL